MKIASFLRDGIESYGAVIDSKVLDYGLALRQTHPTLRDFIAAGAFRQPPLDQFKKYDLSEIKLLIPASNLSKIICIGLNYKAHAAEGGFKIPEFPQVFTRCISSFVANGEALIRPKISNDFDFEGELAIVMGKPARHVAVENALDYVFGYTCFNDGSIRDIQFNHSLIAGKNFPSSGSIGPYIVTADEIGDPASLYLTTRLNKQIVQSKGLDDLICSVPQIISYISSIIQLEPGDVIATGTPEGVGFARKPPLWMKPGDVIEVEISNIGVLKNNVSAEV
jgi:2-keto-4-pentenoate hydratase/2-oxohepta-3-ene-1,7-dioic acid hydratase in catechol pathway